MMKRVLFVTYGGGHAQMVTPVVAALDNRVEIKVLGLPAALTRLKDAGINALTFVDMLDPVQDAQALAWGEELAALHHSDQSGIPRMESVAYLGLSFADLVQRNGLEAAQTQVRERGRHAFHPIGVLKRVCQYVGPHMVVATSSPRAEAAALEVARERGIATLAMIDLFSGVEGYVIPAADATFLTQASVDLCAAQGVFDPKATRAHVLGNPAFDRLLDRGAIADPGWIARQLPWANGRSVVLHADMPAWLDSRFGGTYTKTDADIWAEMEAVYQACQKIDAAYAVRPHPSQDRTIFERFVARHANSGIVDAPDLHDLLERVDVVVARSTTVALEAAYLKQRVLQLEPDRHADMPLVQMGVATGCSDLLKLASTLRSCLEGDEAHEARKNRLHTVLPQRPAAEAIAELILTRAHAAPELNETSE